MEHRFRGARILRPVYAGAFGLFALMFMGQAFSPGKGGAGLSVFATASAILCGVLAVRGARSAIVIVRDTGVEYRSLLRTRRWTWPQVESFEARDSREGAMGYLRRVLFIQEAQGAQRKLQEINAAARRDPNPIDAIADQLNRLSPS